MELAFYFEQAGIGMNREECYRMWLGLKSLVDNHLLQHVRYYHHLCNNNFINYIIRPLLYNYVLANGIDSN